MRNISSQLTLAFKVFFPTLWITFFGTLVGYILFAEDGNNLFGGALAPGMVKIIAGSYFAIGVATFYYFFMRLKRVELDEHYLYVTNYFKTVRYPFHNIEKIQVGNFLRWHPTRVYLKTPGIFGIRFTFLANKQLNAYLTEHPEVASQLTIVH